MTRMDCGEIRDLLQAYDDDELPASERAAIAQHLQGCAACAGILAEHQALRKGIRACGTFAMPAGLEARIRSAIGIESHRQKHPNWRRYAGKAASHAAVAALGAFLAYAALTRVDVRAATSRDIVAAHVRSMLAGQPTQVVSSESHTVRPWFTGKVAFAAEVVDLGARGFPLLGGRVDFVLDHPAAVVVYGRRKHLINLFVLPASQAPNTGEFMDTRYGYNIASWRDGEFSYFAASDLNAAELQEFAQALRSPGPR